MLSSCMMNGVCMFTHFILISLTICLVDSIKETVLQSPDVTRRVSSALDFWSESNQSASALKQFGLDDGIATAVSDGHLRHSDWQFTPCAAQDVLTTTKDSNVLVPGLLNSSPSLFPQAPQPQVTVPQAQCDNTRSEHMINASCCLSVQVADMYRFSA